MIHDFKEYCKLFNGTTSCPISYYNKDAELVISYPHAADELDFTGAFLPSLLHATKNPNYYISNSFSYYGLIKINRTSDFLIIGPIFSTPLKTATIKGFMHEAAIPSKHESAVTQFFLNNLTASFNQFLYTLSFLHFCVNDEVLDLIMYFGISDATHQRGIYEKHSHQIYDAKEKQEFHNTYHFEQQYLEYVKNGDPENLKRLMQEAAISLKEGSIAENALRQSKNIFIAGATLTTRSAIAGGLDIEQAYYLSDIYINKCEAMQSLDALANLQFTMIIDFAERVSKNKIPQGMSGEIFKCIQYISRHTNEPIRVNDVSEHIGRSRSYISKKFKAELGFDLNAFIMRCKLEEAKSLLAYSDKALSEISSYLCFSSQAYFQNVFKKKYGMTPLQYRKNTK